MSRTIKTKDGIVLKNIPDGVSDDQIKARIAEIRSGNGGGAIEEPVKPTESIEEGRQALLNPPMNPELKSKIDQAILTAPGGSFLAELGSAITRGSAGTLDFFVSDPINAVMQLSKMDQRMPTAREGTDLIGASQGMFMEPGMARNLTRQGGEYITPGMMATGTARTLTKARNIMKPISEGKALQKGYEDMVIPFQDKVQQLKQVDYMNISPLGTKTPKLAKRQQEMARLLQNTSGVKTGNLHQTNYTAVKSAIKQESQALLEKLKKVKVLIKPNEFNQRLTKQFKEELKLNPLINKESQTLKTVRDQAVKIFNNFPQTPAGMYQARKKFDLLLKKLIDKDTPTAEAYRITRKIMNNMIKEKASKVAVKESLHKQSLLLDAKDVLKNKAIISREKPTAYGRGSKWLKEHTPSLPISISR